MSIYLSISLNLSKKQVDTYALNTDPVVKKRRILNETAWIYVHYFGLQKMNKRNTGIHRGTIYSYRNGLPYNLCLLIVMFMVDGSACLCLPQSTTALVCVCLWRGWGGYL